MKEVELIEKLAEMFKHDLYLEYNREIAEPDYLNQSDYASCYDRAADGINNATLRIKNVAALAVAKSREEKHGDNTLDEQASLMSVMSGDEIEVASSESYWRD